MTRGENRFATSFLLMCLWSAFSSIHSLSSHDSWSLDYDTHHQLDSNTYHPAIARSTFGEESPAVDEINEPPVSEGEDDGEEAEDALPDESSLPSSPRSRPASSPVLLIMNQDQVIEQEIDGNSYPSTDSMIDDPLDGSSSRHDARRSSGTSSAGDLFPAAATGRHQRQNGHQGFFQYARQPAKGAWEFGYRRGNNEHFTERHEHGASHHVKAKIRWGDKYGGYGEHYFDYNHKGVGEEMPLPHRQRQPQPRLRHQNHFSASQEMPLMQKWTH